VAVGWCLRKGEATCCGPLDSALASPASLAAVGGRAAACLALAPSSLLMTLRIVWRGRCGNQVSSCDSRVSVYGRDFVEGNRWHLRLTQAAVGRNCCCELCVFELCAVMSDGRLVVDVFRDVEREKDSWPTGCFPRAFSLMLRDCMGRSSSTALVEAPSGAENAVLALSLPSSSSSSSSPIANASCSGTLPRCAERAETGVLALSIDALRAGLLTPVGSIVPEALSLRS